MLLVGFVEETFFRGIIFNSLRDKGPKFLLFFLAYFLDFFIWPVV